MSIEKKTNSVKNKQEFSIKSDIQLWNEIKDLQSPPKILSALKRNLPDEFFYDNTISHTNLLDHPSEVILSECFIKTRTN